MRFIEKIKEQARKEKKKIILPETMDERVLKAAEIILQEEIADLILLGNREEVLKQYPNLNKAEIIDPLTSDLAKEFQEKLYDLRKEKGMTLEEAGRLLQ